MRIALPLSLLLGLSCTTTGSTLSARRDAYPVSVEVEGGAVWQSRNDVRIPGDDGTRFSMKELIGAGPYATGRVTADWDIDGNHAVRAVAAPFQISGKGRLNEPTDFDGQRFDAGTPTEGTYKFSNYRLGYRYTFLHEERWRLRAGATLFVRDAEIELEQGGIRASDSNVGLVPLLHLAAEYYPTERWRVLGELEGLASAQGRAFDIAVKGAYDVTDACSLGLGYRTVEGGADNDSVYSFAWFHSIVASAACRF